MFEITATSIDEQDKRLFLGKVSFDLQDYVGKSESAMRFKFIKPLLRDSEISFKLNISPEDEM